MADNRSSVASGMSEYIDSLVGEGRHISVTSFIETLIQSVETDAIPDDDASVAHMVPEETEDTQDATATYETVDDGSGDTALFSLPSSSRSRVDRSRRPAGVRPEVRPVSIMSALAARSSHVTQIVQALSRVEDVDPRAAIARREIESLDEEALARFEEAEEFRQWQMHGSYAFTSASNAVSTSTATATAGSTSTATATVTPASASTSTPRRTHRRAQSSLIIGIYELYSSDAAESFRNSGSTNGHGA